MPHCHRFRSVVLLGKSEGGPLEWLFYELAIDRHRDMVSVVGSVPSVSAGEWVTVEGHWIQDGEFGQGASGLTIPRKAIVTTKGGSWTFRNFASEGVFLMDNMSNAFLLVAAKAGMLVGCGQGSAQQLPPPAAKYHLTGITVILGNKRAMLSL